MFDLVCGQISPLLLIGGPEGSWELLIFSWENLISCTGIQWQKDNRKYEWDSDLSDIATRSMGFVHSGSEIQSKFRLGNWNETLPSGLFNATTEFNFF